MRPFQRRSREAPMDYTYDSVDRDVYAPNSPFRPAWASSSQAPSAPTFPTPQHVSGPSSYSGGTGRVAPSGSWNTQSTSMPAPDIVDISMDSIDAPPSPRKPSSLPPSPKKQQPANDDSGSDESPGALVPIPRHSSRKPSNRVTRRPRRAMSAPINENSDSGGSTEGDTYRGPKSLSNHYTMHVNAPGSIPPPVSPYAPHILLGYVRVIFNVALVLGLLYIIIIIVVTVRRDVEDKVSSYMGENAAEIQRCATEYAVNGCGPDMKIPHMRQFCEEWAQCMKRDASVVGRARVAAETLAEVVNGFVEPITWKTLGFSVSTLAFLILFINVSVSLMRPQEPRHPAHYPYQPPPYPMMQPEWGSIGWNEGQEPGGPKMIRASSEVPGRERRSVSVRR